jgi:methylated-DNA-[protein]-cysteine S-methyltransferase
VRSPIGLRRVILPQSSPERVVELLGIRTTDLESDISVFGDLPRRLSRYFEGQMISFDDELDVADATRFYQRVWEATRTIPYGETQSYALVAEQVGKPGAARAVGQAMAKNPVPLVVPCHRVIASGRGLGGYGGGLEMKCQLLEMESRWVSQSTGSARG